VGEEPKRDSDSTEEDPSEGLEPEEDLEEDPEEE